MNSLGLWIAILLADIAAGVLVGFVARSRGRGELAWFAISVLFTPLIALLALMAMPIEAKSGGESSSSARPVSAGAEEALSEGRARWGSKADVVQVDDGYCFVGVRREDGKLVAKGRGWTWERAFKDANERAREGES